MTEMRRALELPPAEIGESTNGTPLYQIVSHQIRDALAGQEPTGDLRIPSEREIAHHYDVSRITARAAIDLLAMQGIVVRRGTSGVYRAPRRIELDLASPRGFHQQLRDAGLVPSAKLIDSRIVGVDQLPSELETYEPRSVGDEFYRITRLRTSDNDPVAVEVSFFPVDRFPGLLDYNLTSSIYGILKRHFGIEVAASEHAVEANLAQDWQARLLKHMVNAPAMVVRRKSMDDKREPFEFATDVFRGDRFVFVTRSEANYRT